MKPLTSIEKFERRRAAEVNRRTAEFALDDWVRVNGRGECQALAALMLSLESAKTKERAAESLFTGYERDEYVEWIDARPDPDEVEENDPGAHLCAEPEDDSDDADVYEDPQS